MKMSKMTKVITVAAVVILICGMGAAYAGDMVEAVWARCWFSVDGYGSFSAGPYNTASGNCVGAFTVGASIPLSATPASGWKFDHWTFNGNFGGTSPRASVPADYGLRIRACFVRI